MAWTDRNHPEDCMKIKRCPRCNQMPALVYTGLNEGCVECYDCEIRTPEMEIVETIGMWNRWISIIEEMAERILEKRRHEDVQS